jgi:hypothetical protein
MCPSEIAKTVADIAVAVAAAVTAGVAVYGVKSWARELHGRARFEVARSLAKATYKLRDAIRVARTPLIVAGEFPEDYRSSLGGKADPEVEARAYAHVFSARWEPIAAAYQEFDAQTLEAEALWGEPVRSKTNELRVLLQKLRAAMEAFVANSSSGGEDFRADREFGKQIRSEVFATTSDDKNEFSKSVAAAVKSIEHELLPHLRRA